MKLGKVKKWIFIVLTLGITLFCLYAYQTKNKLLYSFALKIFDNYFKFHTSKLNQNITLILVDEKSINKLGRWPWDRKIVAEGLKKLSSAKVIALDMIFSENTTKFSDLYLADTISNLSNVVCGMFIRTNATQNPSEEIIDILSDSALYRVPEKLPFPSSNFLEVNIYPITESCILSGTFNAISDIDGLFRRYPLGFIFKGYVFPSLGVQALRFYLNEDAIIYNNTIKIGNYSFEFLEDGTVFLNYYKPRYYKNISFSFIDLLNNKIPENKIKNKIVIVGISEAGVTDIRSTPIGLVPGPYLHTTFISNVLNKEVIKVIPKLDKFLIVIFGILPLFLFLLNLSLGVRILFYITFIGSLIFSAIYLYKKTNTTIFIFYPLLAIFLSLSSLESLESYFKHKQESFFRNAFSKYLSKDLLDEILKNPNILKLGGEKREISVLFSDIRGFTSLSEKLNPEELVSLLNIYLTPMTNIILKNKGFLDKYIGDAIMAIWNAPVKVKEHPYFAIKTAYEMIQKIDELNKKLLSKGFPNLNIGIGINTGEAVVGNMGSQDRFEYTAIGDTVNLASRLEGLNKIYFKGKSGVLISEYTISALKKLEDKLPEIKNFIYIKLDKIRVKGKEITIWIYTILENTFKNKKIKEIYEKAYKYYEKEDFKKALSIFEDIKDFPPALALIERCQELLKNPPERWDGVYSFKIK